MIAVTPEPQWTDERAPPGARPARSPIGRGLGCVGAAVVLLIGFFLSGLLLVGAGLSATGTSAGASLMMWLAVVPAVGAIVIAVLVYRRASARR